MARSDDVDPETPRRDADTPNPVWFKPIMFGFMLLGLVWVLVFYVSGGVLPIPGIEAWNLAIGFGIALIGFLMTTRWR
ncbi:cell division protein CrgA [Microbacterium sp. LRZ72]|uniref:cell division protein CrgA n=1 Tax=Microbacterium sp. LRZ72 TaxID=2942481 RepID=UPI0029AF664C|nr:cell division protein CrgA [Microbacterium sp. LRZ72]MDX2376250.1 cell division protein CrgA [Microbacterium sp. LRZ72]